MDENEEENFSLNRELGRKKEGTLKKGNEDVMGMRLWWTVSLKSLHMLQR